MKTTVDISDSLMAQAKSLAEKEGVTVRSLIEDGLRTVIAERTQPRRKFRLKDGAVGGKGIRPGLDWPAIRSMIYEGRGG